MPFQPSTPNDAPTNDLMAPLQPAVRLLDLRPIDAAAGVLRQRVDKHNVLGLLVARELAGDEFDQIGEPLDACQIFAVGDARVGADERDAIGEEPRIAPNDIGNRDASKGHATPASHSAAIVSGTPPPMSHPASRVLSRGTTRSANSVMLRLGRSCGMPP